MKENVSIKVSKEKLEEIKLFYNDYLVENNGEYIYFQANKDGLVITGYTSKKANQTITFVGDNALYEARIFDETAELNEVKTQLQENWICLDSQIGSDEVGVGDFLLPMIVVAAFVSNNQIKLLKELGVHDSKKLNDNQIMEIGPRLVKEFKYSKLTLTNEKYNEMYEKCENINSLKAKMHNRALLNMKNENPDINNIFVDQFVNEKLYYSYLNDDKETKVRGIAFKTKGESYFPSVALASVIARYSFLLEKEKLQKELGLEIPFGASKKADETARKILETKGKDVLDKLVKKNFANYSEIFKQ